MKLVRFSAIVAAGLFSLALISSPALRGQTKAAAPAGNYNLYQEIVAHQATIVWATNAPAVPSDVCSIFKTCNGAAAKGFILPAATLDGTKTGRALYVVPTKDAQHPDVVLLHQTSSAVYFFLLDTNGNLTSTAYFEAGKPWYHIANSLAQSKFDRDKKDWHDWVSKLGAKTP
jgi:hypothetical protein